MHVALPLSDSNKHKSLLLSHLFMLLQNFSLMFVSDLFLDFFKMSQQSKRNALFVLGVGNILQLLYQILECFPSQFYTQYLQLTYINKPFCYFNCWLVFYCIFLMYYNFFFWSIIQLRFWFFNQFLVLLI